MPFLQPLFVVFYIYSAWALLAVMTGVVSENMIAIRDQMQKEDEQREEKRKSMITKVLMELFREADVDNNGIVSRQEFEGMLKSPELVKKITKNTRMKVQDLIDLFDWIDHDKGGTITIDEFMNGFRWINEPLRAKSLVKLQAKGGKASDAQAHEVTRSSIIQKRVDEVQRTVAVPLRKDPWDPST
ncbi:Catsper1, partial [Symbiodinium sp. CCMP2456]